MDPTINGQQRSPQFAILEALHLDSGHSRVDETLTYIVHPVLMAYVYIVYQSGYGDIKLQAETLHRGAASVAEPYGRRIAEITQRWVKAKSV